MGALSEFSSGYQRVDDEKARKKFEQAWDQEIPPSRPFLLEMLDKILEGRIKASMFSEKTRP